MLVAYEEVVEIYKTLALATTNGEAFNPDLAGSLNNLSNFLSGLGRREEATVASEKAVEIYITLAMTNSKAFNSDLARSLHNLSCHLRDAGDNEGALAAIKDSVSIYRHLFRQDPVYFQPLLAEAISTLNFYLEIDERMKDARLVEDEAGQLPSFVDVGIQLSVSNTLFYLLIIFTCIHL